MSQTYTANCYQSDHVAVTDMANIEANFATLRSCNSGASAPANTEAGLLWFDTSTAAGTDGLLKIRHDENNAWLAVLCGDASQKFWVYRNTTMDGWIIDATVTDRVLSLKGGTGLYNANGGTVAGETWANLKAHVHTGGTHTHAHGNHVHQIYSTAGSGDHHSFYNAAGTATIFPSSNWTADQQMGVAGASGDHKMNAEMYTNLTITVAGATSGATGNTGAQSTADVRPQAALGTLQYPDI